MKVKSPLEQLLNSPLSPLTAEGMHAIASRGVHQTLCDVAQGRRSKKNEEAERQKSRLEKLAAGSK